MTRFVITIAVRNANSRYSSVYVGDFRYAPVMEQSYIERALLSARQDYPDYRIVIRDDASTDGTWEKIQEMADSLGVPVDAKQNPARIGTVANHLQMAQVIDDDEVMVVLDGDDQLAGPYVLSRLAEAYCDPQTWISYGSFHYDEASRDKRPGTSAQGTASQMIEHSRRAPFSCTHLRTYKRWLFDRIRVEDLKKDGAFYPLIPDLVTMFPMIEMAGPQHARFIPDVLYYYNSVNPYNELKGPGAWPTHTEAHQRIQQEGMQQYGHEHILVREEIDALVEYFCNQQRYPRLGEEKGRL